MARPKRFDKFQVDILKKAFKESERLTKQRKIYLAEVTGLGMEQIASWFNRKRARKRAKESRKELEKINTQLKQSLQQRKEFEAKLEKELQETKQREAELKDENERLKRRLMILEDDPMFDPISWFLNEYP